MMNKIILVAVFTLILTTVNAQVSIDSIINLSLIQHRKGFEFQQKKYSTDRIFYIKNRTLNDEIEVDKSTGFLLDCVESSAFEKWRRKKIGKGKIVIAINKISFEENKILFFVIGGVVKKKKKPIQVFSENYVYAHYDIESTEWQYSFKK